MPKDSLSRSTASTQMPLPPHLGLICHPARQVVQHRLVPAAQGVVVHQPLLARAQVNGGTGPVAVLSHGNNQQVTLQHTPGRLAQRAQLVLPGPLLNLEERWGRGQQGWQACERVYEVGWTQGRKGMPRP
jgi:hypothetical protein